MKKAIRAIGVVTLIIGSAAALLPAYAQNEKKPPARSDMVKDGGMDGMMGMMEQMNKMVGLRNKMMESAMNSPHKKMPMESPATPENKG